MAYSKTTWQDGANQYTIKTSADVTLYSNVKLVYVGTSGGTALSSTVMQNIEDGVEDAHDGSIGFVVLAQSTLTATATAQIDLSVATGYKDLLVIGHLISSAATSLRIRFNSDASSNYTYQMSEFTNAANYALGTSSTYILTQALAANIIHTASGNSNGLFTMRATNNSAKHKEVFIQASNSENQLTLIGSGKWGVSSAEITSISLIPSAGNFSAGTRVTLLGVK